MTWRQGTNEPLSSRLVRVRLWIAHRDFDRSEPWPEEWLLIEWPKGEEEPKKYWLSRLVKTIGFVRLVDLTKLRWRIEHAYEELKLEIGLGPHFGCSARHFLARLSLSQRLPLRGSPRCVLSGISQTPSLPRVDG